MNAENTFRQRLKLFNEMVTDRYVTRYKQVQSYDDRQIKYLMRLLEDIRTIYKYSELDYWNAAFIAYENAMVKWHMYINMAWSKK